MSRLIVPVHVRWGDLDPYGHVNNVDLMRLLEEARIAAFWRRGIYSNDGPQTAILGAGADGSTLTFVARHEVEYLAPMGHLTEPARVELWISAMGGASIDVDYEIYAAQTLCARARTVLVMIDPATNRPRRITDSEREIWQSATDSPIVFRR